MIDCITCLTRRAQSCPTNGRTHEDGRGITHAMTTIASTHFDDTRDAMTHGFRWSRYAGRWMFFLGIKAHWATKDQR